MDATEKLSTSDVVGAGLEIDLLLILKGWCCYEHCGDCEQHGAHVDPAGQAPRLGLLPLAPLFLQLSLGAG